LYEEKQTKRLVLVTRLRLADEEQTRQFFEKYSQALLKKHGTQANVRRKPNFLSFDTPDGGVFFRCAGKECVTVEGTTRAVFDALNKAMGWPAATESAAAPARIPMNALAN
jgi:hypothetical protein